MIRFMILIAITCLSSTASADEILPSINWPTLPQVIDDQPQPQPPNPGEPQPVSVLRADEMLVVESTVQVFVRRFPEGIVDVEQSAGPMKVRAKFADGNGKIQTREYTAPYVYFLTSVKSGKVTLDLVPIGVSAENDIARRELSVTDGTTPIPPPDPGPAPKPQPEPPKPDPQPVKSFRVIFVKESGVTLSSAQSSIPGASEIRSYLNVATTQAGGSSGWREYDPQQITVDEQLSMSALWAAVKPQLLPAPCMVVEVNGKATVMPFPANVAECMTTLKKYGGD